ncbi:hypothetical protein [Ilumatobacter sp.]|uniref:hypothetical protein n=1 Tax=Ilumatobacter sp. TaxID=1967498 RepID=UPI003AF799E4
MTDAATAATVSDGHEPTNAIDPIVGPERVAVRFSLDPVPEPERGPDPAIAAVDHGLVPEPSGVPLDHLPAPVCAGSLTTVDDLTAFFDGGAPLIGADYQRVHPLPDGRVLWLFQDAFLPTSHGPALVHNVGLLQSGNCFQLLRNGSYDAPTSYLFPDLTDRFGRWFWPLGGGVGRNGNLSVFVAEMIEQSGGYLDHTEPVATWLVTIDVDDLSVIEQRRAPNDSPDLYGWSVVSAGEHTYLYSHCYRQFGFDPLWFAPTTFAHDLDCTADVGVARIPRSTFEATPVYWNGSSWVDDPNAAVAVIPQGGRDINPTQVTVVDGQFVAVTKVGDWWGREVVLDAAPAAEGPWRTYATIPIEPECDGCNTYFASIVPFGADGTAFVVALSCNTWDGDDLDHYTPTFLRAPLPVSHPA